MLHSPDYLAGVSSPGVGSAVQYRICLVNKTKHALLPHTSATLDCFVFA